VGPRWGGAGRVTTTARRRSCRGGVRRRVRAGAALALSGRYAFAGRDAANGLRHWAAQADVDLAIVDGTSDGERTAVRVVELAGRCELLFGPYGSGPMRAVQQALAGAPWVVWNHGAAAARPTTIRQIHVLAPAERYWAGLPQALSDAGADLTRIAILTGRSPFGRAVAAGLRDALASRRLRALWDADVHPRQIDAHVDHALRLGADVIVGCGRREDDLALATALRGRPVYVGLVLCGLEQAAQDLGPALLGWFGPSQWPGDGPVPEFGLPPGAQYPAAQSAAAGMVAQRALAVAGSADPDALWQAATTITMQTHLGRFAVDGDGRQQGACPSIVQWVRDTRHAPALRTVWRPPDGSRG
jgi:branched-chain amino acid transport system substrate-binding protein